MTVINQNTETTMENPMTNHDMAKATEHKEKMLTLLEGRTLEVMALRNSRPVSVSDVPESQRCLLLFALDVLADELMVRMGDQFASGGDSEPIPLEG